MGLLRGQNLDEALREMVELERAVHVPVEGGGEELREEKDAPHPRVDAVGDGDVHQAVLAREGHGGLGALPSEREQARSLAASHDDGKHPTGVRSGTRGSGHGGLLSPATVDRKRANRSMAGSRIARSAA